MSRTLRIFSCLFVALAMGSALADDGALAGQRAVGTDVGALPAHARRAGHAPVAAQLETLAFWMA